MGDGGRILLLCAGLTVKNPHSVSRGFSLKDFHHKVIAEDKIIVGLRLS